MDGQQRVTTLLLLVAALRDVGRHLASSSNNNKSEQIAAQLLERRSGVVLNKQGRSRLVPTTLDRVTFARATVETCSRLERVDMDPISQAKAYFVKGLHATLHEGGNRGLHQKFKVLNRLLGGVLYRMNFLVFEMAEDTTSLHRVYHRMAIREEFLRPWFADASPGVGITSTDLIRNHLLALAQRLGCSASMHDDFWLPLESVVLENMRQSSTEGAYSAALSQCLVAFLKDDGMAHQAFDESREPGSDPPPTAEPPLFSAFKAWRVCKDATCVCSTDLRVTSGSRLPACLEAGLQRLLIFAEQWVTVHPDGEQGPVQPPPNIEHPPRKRPAMTLSGAITKDTPKFATTMPPWLMNR
jgi:hypothetical protein